MDYKTTLLQEFSAELLEDYDGEAIDKILHSLIMKLADYDIFPAEHSLAIVDDRPQQLLKLFLATKKIEGRTDATLKHYNYIIRKMYEAIRVPVEEITVYHLRKYMAELKIKGIGINTIANIRAVICSYFSWLYNDGLIPTNPSAQLGRVKPEKFIELPFSAVEMEQIKRACPNARDLAIVEFLRSTGCRINEVVHLNVKDINFEEKECIVHGKGKKDRVVFLDDVCLLHLKEYLDSRDNPSEALFPGKGTPRMTDDGIRIMLKRIEKASGVTNIHPHRFRRTLATNLIRYGMAVQDVGRVLGHANLNTTMRYVYQDEKALKSAYEKLIR